MSRIDWGKHKDQIITLSEAGLSSSQIEDVLVKQHGNHFKGKSRNIRYQVAKAGLGQSLPKQSKVLVFDIETAPLIAYTWGIWNVNIGTDFIIRDWFVYCWSAKWLFNDEVMSMSLSNEEIKEANDKRIMQGLWNLFEEADIIIAHNLDKFDEKRSKTRFLKYGLGLPSPYAKVDTLKVARSNFNITSNRLDYIAKKFLGIEGKMETPRGLWQMVDNCVEGAMQTMVDYCEQDVKVLEDVYLYLRPYHRQHPNIGLIEEDLGVPVCKTCGSEHIKECGEHRTMVGAYTAFRCTECKSISYGRKTQVDKQHSQNLLK